MIISQSTHLIPSVYCLRSCLVRPLRRCVVVSDGDTIKLLTAARQQIRVRIAFIDAPEKGQPFSQRAKQAPAPHD